MTLNFRSLLTLFHPAGVERRLVGRSSLFDHRWYNLAHPHVMRSDVTALDHLLAQRSPPFLAPSRAFDAAWYAERHPEAATAGCHPLVHYLRIGRARGYDIRPAPASAADRVAASGLFDPGWYLDAYPDVAAAGFPPLLHYMVHGWAEGRATSDDFDGGWYVHRYPDIRGLNPLVHFIDHGRREGRRAKPDTTGLGIARATLAGVEDLDPELYAFDYFGGAERLEVVDGSANNAVDQVLSTLVAEIAAVPRYIVFLPWLVHGGSDLVAGHAVRALVEAYGPASVLVVLTDHDREEAPHLLPDGVQTISFSRADPHLSPEYRVELVELLVRGLQPEAILNVNSRACWEVMRHRGRLMRQFTRTYAMLFCPDFSADGRRCGYADIYLRDSLPNLCGVYFDNAAFLDELAAAFAIPPDLKERMVMLPQPAPMLRPPPARGLAQAPFRLLWAGRLSRQKNIDLLLRIGEGLPETFELDIWGRGDPALVSAVTDLAARRKNVSFRGAYKCFEALPLEDYGAYLYTSLWDGLPNVLLEAAGAGLPIVAPHVGGIGELINPDTGWLVKELAEPSAYLAAIEEICRDDGAARRRVAALQALIAKNHNWDRYRAVLSDEPSRTKGLLHAQADDHGGAQCAPRGNARKAVVGKPEPVRGARRARRA